ncbi:FMN-binding protein [Oribacterium sp. C9]|uniref:FMN-binding protein n=1 Tax=Oribacterium sp. C9 TaxID=1943579 RepID=UPI0009901EE5|nr:FMN-binding protein [Oribacterium sp. C9]OON85671.1 FMN-binding protein [Oribacterium sp. C9]
MKKQYLTAAAALAALAITACGSQSAPESTTAAATTAAATTEAATSEAETLTGEADGFGGKVTVELTVKEGTITDAVITGDGETPTVGGAALDTLKEQVIAANGPDIDGVSGATVTSTAVKNAVSAAMGLEVAEPETKAPAVSAPAEIVPVEGGIQMGQVITAAHGNKCFSQVTAVVKDDVVIAAYIDEYQFGAADSVTGVPNGDDKDNFGAGFAEGQMLFSKRVNADYYSKNMAEKAGSTVRLNDNYDEIQKFAVGKTLDELAAYKGDATAVDAVSGATLADTGNYLAAIGEAGKIAQKTQAVEFNGSSEDLKLNMAIGAAHGNKCFSTAAVLTDGKNVILSWIDDFQFGASADVEGVPNSDDADNFGAGYADPANVLFSKRVNADYYSDLMNKKANATVRIDENYNAIQNHVNGMSISDVKALSEQADAVDAVSGATLADTAGYVGLIAEAAK